MSSSGVQLILGEMKNVKIKREEGNVANHKEPDCFLKEKNSILSAFFPQQIPFDILHFLDNLIKAHRKELQNFSFVKENLSSVTFLLHIAWEDQCISL